MCDVCVEREREGDTVLLTDVYVLVIHFSPRNRGGAEVVEGEQIPG